MAALRSRHAFLMTFAGIMRYESLHKRNLSDLYSFTWKAKKDIHRFLVTMFQLPSGKLVVGCVLWFFSLVFLPFASFRVACTGKTNHGIHLFGRAMRFKDVLLCPVGALALYLFYCFSTLYEMDPPRLHQQFFMV
jgi:hypothetical protein